MTKTYDVVATYEENSLRPVEWPNPHDIMALESYGVLQVLIIFHLSWDGAISKYFQVLGSHFGQDEGLVMARLGREGFSAALSGLKETTEEVLAKRYSKEYEGNYEGTIVVDVKHGTYLMGTGGT